MKKIRSRAFSSKEPVMSKTKSIFAVTCSATPELRNIMFFATIEGARKYLKSLADERRHNLGVHWHEETEDMFFYTLGWEEHPVRFFIVELAVGN
jgi:hypothetical protein